MVLLSLVVVVELLAGTTGCCTDELSSVEVVVVEEVCPAQPVNATKVTASAEDKMIFFMCWMEYVFKRLFVSCGRG